MEIKIIWNTDLRCSVFLFGVLLFFMAFPSNAQEELNSTPQKLPGEAPSIRFERISLEDGLQQGSILDIIQDRQGYLWMTTQDGLHRYDGYEFKVFTTTPFDTTSLSVNSLWSVTEASNGDLWITTEGGGINRMDRTTGRFSHYLHDPDDSTSISSNITTDVKESQTGDLWVTTYAGGLNRMPAGEEGKFLHYRHDPNDTNSISSDNLTWINEDANGMIWASSNTGLNRIDPKTGKVTRFLVEPGGKGQLNLSDNVHGLYFPPEEPGTVWVATGVGLVNLNTETGSKEIFVIDESKDPLNRLNVIRQVIPDPTVPGILWVGGPVFGVARFDISTEEFTSYRHDPRDPNSLSEDEVFSLFADRSGTIWAGHTAEGLSIFNPGAVNFSHLRHDADDMQSLSPGPVWGIFEDTEKTLWVGTFYGSQGGYITQFSGKTGLINRHTGSSTNTSKLPLGQYNAFAEDKLGQFWVGGKRGLSKLNPETGEVVRFVHKSQIENEQRNYIGVIIPADDSENELWIGSAAGLDLFNVESGTYQSIELTPEDLEKEPVVISLLTSIDGILWVGTLEGLYRIDHNRKPDLASAYNLRDTTTINHNFIMALYEREEEPGILWLATGGGGLNRFDTKTGIVKHYLEKDGLPNNIIYGILEDSKGSLWMSTNKGISNFDPGEESFRNYGLDDGLMALEYNQYAYFKGADGMMYFGSPKGVTAFVPEKLNINETPPQVVLAGLKLFNKEVAPGPTSLLKKPLSDTEKITLNYNQNEITFDFVALHYGNSLRNTYAYILEGFDADWVDAGTRRSASYTNLPPGSYSFRVKAANADGIWSQEEASVQLSVLPPWYRTWWAYLIFAVLLGLIIYGIDRIQRKRLRKKEEERTALQEAELRAEAENRRRADTEQLSNIGRAITSTLSITRIIDTVYEHVNQLMDAAIFGIGIYNPEKKRLEFPATKEKGKMLRPYTHGLDEENRLAVWCFNNSKEVIIGDAAKESGNYINKYLPPVKGDESQSVIYLPLVQQGRTIGVITTQSFKRNAFTPYHVQLLRNLATYAAIALDNASAYRKLDSTLSDLKLMQEQLVQQEKLASLGQLTAGIAHEIKNPLNFVNNFSELSVELIDETREELKALKSKSPTSNGKFSTISELLDDIEGNLRKIHKHGTRADGIVRSMLQHSRGGSGTMEPVELNELVKEYVNLSFHGMRAGKNPINVEIDLQLDEQIGKVPLIEEDFSRVIINLCNNAFEAMREKSLVPSANGGYLPKITVRTMKQNGKVKIEFEDNGPGIAEENRDKILQPFFTTKRGTEGTGLGLSITHDIVKVHGGTLSIESTLGRGTCFSIKLPQNQQVEAKEPDIEIN